MFEPEGLKVGSGLMAAEFLVKGECDVAFSFSGGFHHGGHLFFLAMEKLRGSPVSLTVQERAAQVSLVLLVTLVVTPVAYSLFDQMQQVGLAGLVGRLRRRLPTPDAVTPL